MRGLRHKTINVALALPLLALAVLQADDVRAQTPPAGGGAPAGAVESRRGIPPRALGAAGGAPRVGGAGAAQGSAGTSTGTTAAAGAAGAGAAGGAAGSASTAGGTAGTAGTGAPGAAGGAAGKPGADTDKLPQFESGVEFEPRSPNYRVAFSLEDADLPELVRVIGQLTGKRFIFGGKVRNIKATVYSPQKVTVAEAYQAFLSILETNGLTVIPHGRFLKIVETQAISNQETPVYGATQAAPSEDRYVTRMHRLHTVNANEVSEVLSKFKSKEGDISVYAPSNLLIMTDTGSNIRRMMSIVEEIDVGGAGDQIWIEPVHYASASDVASRVNELFDLKGGGGGGGSSSPNPKGGAPVSSGGGGGGAVGGGDLHVSKILPDDRTNSVVIVATEKAYLRILELIKKIDVPQSSEGEIHVLPLQHADAVELTKTLSEIITGTAAAAQQGATGGGRQGATGGATSVGTPPTGIFEGGVKVSADKATNSIVVTSSLRDYASLRAVVDRLDLPRRQVFIEAVIMDLSIRRSSQLGIHYHGGDTFSAAGHDGGLAYGGLDPLKTIGLPDPNSLQGLALGVRGPGIQGSENLLGTGITIPAFGVLINALAQSGDADVLSTPHILATDNIAAEINVGENIPLQTNAALPNFGGAAGAAGAAGALGALGGLGGFGGSGARQDVGTKIKIIPHLNESNEVRLELTEEISEAKEAQGTLGVVPITKRNAQTQLVVADQQTVIIGGLMRNRIVHTADKIPVLGDIPVLGALFRSSTNGMEKTNLILILTPYVIREQADLRTIFERKMQERQEFLDRYFVFSDQQDYQPPKDYARTNGLVEAIRQSYRSVEEKKKLEELTKPKELQTHEPQQPLEMPAVSHVGGAGTSANTPPVSPDHSGATIPAGTPTIPPAQNQDAGEGGRGRLGAGRPPVNVQPAPRQVVKDVEK